MITNIPNATFWDPDSTQLEALLRDTVTSAENRLRELEAEGAELIKFIEQIRRAAAQ